jgi:hypothetical protein
MITLCRRPSPRSALCNCTHCHAYDNIGRRTTRCIVQSPFIFFFFFLFLFVFLVKSVCD